MLKQAGLNALHDIAYTSGFGSELGGSFRYLMLLLESRSRRLWRENPSNARGFKNLCMCEQSFGIARDNVRKQSYEQKAEMGDDGLLG